MYNPLVYRASKPEVHEICGRLIISYTCKRNVNYVLSTFKTQLYKPSEGYIRIRKNRQKVALPFFFLHLIPCDIIFLFYSFCSAMRFDSGWHPKPHITATFPVILPQLPYSAKAGEVDGTSLLYSKIITAINKTLLV